jgi:hypothetical protein
MPLDVPRPTAITNATDAAIVKGMLNRGDPTHDVAAWFGINSGRIAAIKKGYKEGAKFRDVAPAPEHSLPPPGPYPRPGETMAVIAALRDELRIAQEERRQTNEMIRQLQRQVLAFGRDLKLVEAPIAPTIRRRRPLGQ